MNTSLNKKVTYTGLLMALTFLGTAIFKLPISSTGGYIHLGDAFVMLSGLILGPVYGALAAGIGSALADIIGGYASWALPTLIVKGLMAFIVGYAYTQRKSRFINQLLTISYVVIWGLAIFLARIFFLGSSEAREGSNAFFDMMGEVFNTNSGDKLTVIIIAMMVPLVLVILYKIVGVLYKKEVSLTVNISYVVAGSLMVILYYVTTVILYGNVFTPVIDIPLNILQFILGIIIANLMTPIIKFIRITG